MEYNDQMITDFLNGLILLLVIGIGTIYLLAPDAEDIALPESTNVDMARCKKVAHPVKHTIWGDMSTGYYCVD